MPKWNPEDYERNSSAQQKWADEVLAKLMLRGDEKILDIGCGNGKITAELAARVPQGLVVGLDLSEDMIEYASAKYKNRPNLSFLCGDAGRMSFQREFGLVVSFACLHWVKDHSPVLAGIRRSLRPGGRVVLQFGGRGNAAEVSSAVDEVLSSEDGKWEKYFRDFTEPYNFMGPDEYQNLLKQAGLKVKRLELVPKDMIQAGREGFAGWFRTTWRSHIERVPEDLRKEFIDRVVETVILRNPPDASGQIHIKMMRLEVEAFLPDH